MGIDSDTITRRRHPTSSSHSNTGVASGGAWNSPPRDLKGINKKRRRNSDDDIPFVQLFAQVGMKLLAICFTLWVAYQVILSFRPSVKDSGSLQFELDDDDEISNPEPHKSLTEALKDLISNSEQEAQTEEPTYPPLPTFLLSESSKWDAYGLAATFSGSDDAAFWKESKDLRKRFADTYGGENAARMLLDKGMTTFFKSKDGKVPEDVVHTACRFQRAQKENRPLRLAFAGYSVTSGRGNYFHQSFPFQLQRTLGKVVRLAGVEQGLEVRNAAIGGAPAFPYAFCFENFLGPNPDVISWDYSMNEAGGVPEGLEAYVRHMITTYSGDDGMSIPKLIVKDTHMAQTRRRVLGEYTNLVPDSVVLHTDPATKPFLERYEEYRPIGFQDWRKFGAPNGAPGQAAHHPALKEHELLGWILAMHFLTALEYMVMTGSVLSCPTQKTRPTLPHPVSDRLTNSTNPTYDPILFGHEVATDEWKINPIQCRTTFQPILNGDLSELVVTGSIAEDLDILLPKSQYYYNQGWVLDMSENIKAAMRKLSTYEDNLGFIDSKEAYYGLYESPYLNLLLPCSSSSGGIGSGKEEEGETEKAPQPGQEASKWFESIVLCQVNEQREDKECDFANDVGVSIGGQNVTDISPYMMDMGGTTYLGKKVCSHIPIPNGAVLTSHNTLAGKVDLEVDQVGLLVQVLVTNKHIVHIRQACSISHVVWEEKII